MVIVCKKNIAIGLPAGYVCFSVSKGRKKKHILKIAKKMKIPRIPNNILFKGFWGQGIKSYTYFYDQRSTLAFNLI